MQTHKQHVEITTQAPFYTLNKPGEAVTDVWLVCHGYGQLSEYFLQKFAFLPAENNWVVAPQGLSLLYLDNNYQRVGASWLTKYERQLGLQHQQQYLDKVWQQVKTQQPTLKRLWVLGFSQGASTAVRWAAWNKLPFHRLVIWGGWWPDIDQAKQLHITEGAEIWQVGGTDDPYLKAQTLEENNLLLKSTGYPYRQLSYKGDHRVVSSELKQFIDQYGQ